MAGQRRKELCCFRVWNSDRPAQCTPAHSGKGGSEDINNNNNNNNNNKDGDDKDNSIWCPVSAAADYYEVLYRNICY